MQRRSVTSFCFRQCVQSNLAHEQDEIALKPAGRANSGRINALMRLISRKYESMSVRQIQVANDSVQDRLILRIGTSANEEIRVFITRRFLRDLWPHLTAMLSGHLASTRVEPTAELSDELAPELANEPTASITSFEQAFQDDNPIYPLGAKPLLATEALLEANGDGSASLTLREARERNFKLSLNAELLQALCTMLHAANDHAGWDLSLDHAPPASPVSVPYNVLLH